MKYIFIDDNSYYDSGCNYVIASSSIAYLKKHRKEQKLKGLIYKVFFELAKGEK